MTPTPNQQAERETLIQKLMEQAQVFASAWSLVGGRFDAGSGMEDAEAAKSQLRSMIAAALSQAPVAVPDGYALVPVEPTISMCLAGAAARISVECPTPAEAAYRAMLAASPANADSKESEIGRVDELRCGVHGDLLLRSRSTAALVGVSGASLVDALWESEAVMSLNAELGLTMDQLVRLAKSMLTAAPAQAQRPAEGEPAEKKPGFYDCYIEPAVPSELPTYIPLKGNAAISWHKDINGWIFTRDGDFIRHLDEFETEHIEAAMRAALAKFGGSK
jgi:hypothetical protein